MPSAATPPVERHKGSMGAVFLTFSGNCRAALHFYQSCFGGKVQLQFLERQLPGFQERPVVSGALFSESIVIHASDMVPEEGRITGNHIAIFIQCLSAPARKALIGKLLPGNAELAGFNYQEQLIEIKDAFGVRWVLAV